MRAGAVVDMFKAADELRSHARKSQTIWERIPVACIAVLCLIAVLSLTGTGMAAGAASVAWFVSSIHFASH